jgi:hypothetical protein
MGNQSHVTVRVSPPSVVILLPSSPSPSPLAPFHTLRTGVLLATPPHAGWLLYTRLEKSNHPDHQHISVPLFRFKSVQTTKLTSNYSVSSEDCSIRHPALLPPCLLCHLFCDPAWPTRVSILIGRNARQVTSTPEVST